MDVGCRGLGKKSGAERRGGALQLLGFRGGTFVPGVSSATTGTTLGGRPSSANAPGAGTAANLFAGEHGLGRVMMCSFHIAKMMRFGFIGLPWKQLPCRASFWRRGDGSLGPGRGAGKTVLGE